MKCRQTEHWLLLKDSGELSSRKQLRLERHLASCAHCRMAQDELNRLMLIARQHLAKGEPGARALVAIRNTAEASLQTRKSSGWGRVQTPVIVLWRPALALAAGLLLCLGGWIWLSGHDRLPEGPIVVLSPQAVERAAPSGESLDDLAAMLAEDVVVIERVSDGVYSQELSPLDRDLLLLEGLAI